jgi:hypothetical protein
MGVKHPVEWLLITEKRRKITSIIPLIKTLDKSEIYFSSDAKSVYGGPDLYPNAASQSMY